MLDTLDLNIKPGSVLIDWDGPTGAATEANALLSLIAPRSTEIHWLHCYYEPGERWQPVERLMIAEMIPKVEMAGKNAFFRLMGEQDGDSLYGELEGPNPRLSGHYDKVLGRWCYDGLPPNITLRQWQLWRSERAYARPFWVVQGTRGGHKISFSQLERKVLRFNGRPDQPAWIGQLPFARFDQRILDQLQAMDKLQKWMETRSDDWRNRTTADLDRSRDAAKEEIHDKIYEWLDSQIADLAA